MRTTEHPFRSAAFGGFNRQDVLSYVESLCAEHSSQIWQLNHELEQLRETEAQQREQLNESTAREVASLEENRRLTQELEEAKDGLAGQTALLEETRLALAALEERVAALEPEAAAYARIKDRCASIELEAHARAQEILGQAQAQAEAIYRQAEDWLKVVQERYDELRTDLEATVSHTAGQLGRVQEAMHRALDAFSSSEETLTQMLEAYRSQAAQQGTIASPAEGA